MLLGITFFTFFILHLFFNSYYTLGILALLLFISSLYLILYHKVLKKDAPSNILSENLIPRLILGTLLGIGYTIYANHKFIDLSDQEFLANEQKGKIIQLSKNSTVVEYKKDGFHHRARIFSNIDRSNLSKGMRVIFRCSRFFSEGVGAFQITQNLQKISQKCKGSLRKEERYLRSNLEKFRMSVRSILKQRLEMFPKHTLADGFLLADTEKIHPVEMDFFRKMGIAHLFAASGLHLGLLFAIFYLPFLWLSLPKWGEAIGFIVCSLFLVLLDFPVSLLRAYLFLVIYLVLKYLDRKTSPFYIFFFVACLSEMISPLSVFTYSFLLSFGITGCILLSFPFFRKILSLKLPLQFLNDHLCLTLAAFTGSVFLSYFLFGFSHVLSLFYNFILVPFSGIYLLTVLISILFSPAIVLVSLLDQIFRYGAHFHYLIWERHFSSVNESFMIFWLSLAGIFLFICVWFSLSKKLWYIRKHFVRVLSFLLGIYFIQFFFIENPERGIKAFPYGIVYYEKKNLHYVGEPAKFIQEGRHKFFRRPDIPVHHIYSASSLVPMVEGFSASPLDEVRTTPFEKSWGFIKYQKKCFIFINKRLRLDWMYNKLRNCSRIYLIHPKKLKKLATRYQKSLSRTHPRVRTSKCGFNRWCWE